MVAESYNRMSQHGSERQEEEWMARCQEAARQAVEEYPLVLTIGAFAVGVGLGAMLGASLARPLGLEREAEVERIGRRVLNSIAEFLPDGVQQYLR